MPDSQDTGEPVSVDSGLALLTQTEWEELYLRLRYFIFKYYSHLARRDDAILEDILHDSIIDTYLGKRTRPRDVAIFTFICGIIRSNLSHHFEKESRRANLNISARITKNQSLNNSYKSENLRLDLVSIMKKVEEAIKADEELNLVHQSMTTDPEVKPKEIALSNNLPIDRVKNARKRYVRLVKKMMTA